MTTSTTLTRRLGDAEVFPIGLGEMPLSLKGRPDEDRAIRTIHAALDAGVNLIDTADAYAYDDTDINHGERLVAKALKGRRDGVIVATKGGHLRDGQAWPIDGRPQHIRAACEASLRALETDRIDLYQFHRPDPHVPYAESIGVFRELQDEGKVRWLGISNADTDQIEEALSIADIVSVQNQLSLDFTSPVLCLRADVSKKLASWINGTHGRRRGGLRGRQAVRLRGVIYSFQADSDSAHRHACVAIIRSD